MTAPSTTDKKLQELEETISILRERINTWEMLYDDLNDDFTALAMAVIEAQNIHGTIH